MTKDEAAFLLRVWGEDPPASDPDELCELVAAHIALLDTAVKNAREDVLAEVCRRLKHALGHEAVADKLWESFK